MALSKKSLQRKREKKKSNRKIKCSSASLSIERSYQHWAVHECWVPIELWKNGMGQVVIARRNSQGNIAIGVYLIDTYCLGIKNCFVRLINKFDYQMLLKRVTNSCGKMKLVEPSYANTLIIKAVEYANQCGFEPHSDFAKAKNLLTGISIDETLVFSFGKDGKPCYVQGPNESPADIKRILKTLESSKGDGNYGFFLVKEPYPTQVLELEESDEWT